MKKNVFSDELKMEVVVGSFMVMVLLGLGYFTIILSRDKWFGKQYGIEVVFENVMGLREGDNVQVRGMTVGKVKRLELKQDGVHVYANLDRNLAVREGYLITVVSTSVLGGRYLEVDAGPDKGVILPAQQLLRGTEPTDLMADAAKVIHELKAGLTTGGVVSNIQSIATQFNDIAVRLNSGKGTLGKLLADDDTMYRDLSSGVASLKVIAERVERGEGTMGKLMTDDALYDDVKKAIEDVRATIDDYRETAPVVTFTSIFFGAL